MVLSVATHEIQPDSLSNGASSHAQLCEVLIRLHDLSLRSDGYGSQEDTRTSLTGTLDQPEVPTGFGDRSEITTSSYSQDPSALPNLALLARRHSQDIVPLLKALLPEHEMPSTSGNRVPTSREAHHTLLKLVAYGIVNNFAGIEDHTSRKVTYDFLKSILSPVITSQNLELQLCRDISQLQFLEPLAETMFRGAIEAGDCNMASHILHWPGVDIDVDNVICTMDGLAVTPMEAAASLQNRSLVRLLLHFKADVNKSAHQRLPSFPIAGHACPLGFGGAVFHSCLIPVDRQNIQKHQLRRMDLELVDMLVAAGGTICSSTLRHIASSDGAAIVRLFVSAPVPQGCIPWYDAGVFHEALDRLPLTEQQELLLTMRRSGIDLNAEIQCQSRYPSRILDVVAQCGQLESVQLLRSLQVRMSRDTLIAGIRSSNRALVDFLLSEGALTACFSSHYGTTPLAEAVRLREKGLVELLSSSDGCMNQLYTEHGFCAMLMAAAEVGDCSLLEDLVAIDWTTESIRRELVLGHALTRACENNHETIAIKLLELGACTHKSLRHPSETPFFEQHGSLLISAVANRNEVLVELLLDHDAEGNLYSFGDYKLTALGKCTVEWGSLTVIKRLAAAGMEVRMGSILALAVEMQNYTLVEYLLSQTKLGFTQERYASGPGPLGNAILAKDEAMLDLLLKHVEKWHPISEPNAFSLAWRTAPHLYEILVHKTLVNGLPRHYTDRDLHGVNVLAHCIELQRRDVIDWMASTLHDLEFSFEVRPREVLHAAIKQGNHDILRFVFDLGVDPNVVFNDYGFSPSWVWCTSGPHETALLFAIKCKAPNMVGALIDLGADTNFPAKNRIKRTPLQQAAETGHLVTIELLLSRGAHINASPTARGGGTAIQLAARQGFIGVVQYLAKRGGDLWAPGSVVNGRTALEGAAEHGRFQMAEYLASQRPPDLEQYSKAAGYARKKGHTAIANMLETMQAALIAETRIPIPQRIVEETPITPPENITSTAQTPTSITHRPQSRLTQRRHMCNICNATFTKPFALRRHQRSHKETYAHPCLECDKGFHRKDTLDRHLVAKHSESPVPHQCYVCGDEYSRPDTLSLHMRTKHPEQQREGLGRDLRRIGVDG